MTLKGYTATTYGVLDAPVASASFDGVTHAGEVADRAERRIHTKYLRGQREHGGCLPMKAGMLAHAEDEATDLVIYHDVLRAQLQKIRTEAAALLASLDHVLGDPQE